MFGALVGMLFVGMFVATIFWEEAAVETRESELTAWIRELLRQLREDE